MAKIVLYTVIGVLLLVGTVFIVFLTIEDLIQGKTEKLGSDLFSLLQGSLGVYLTFRDVKKQLAEKRLQENTIRELQEQRNAP